ncbi:galactokinase [Schleiferilactobacillus perolens]|jgi:galactokinase|uniref:galactokinase n=1 Tax=Schleiferilactobacillus perolens TaxID=100468 RepID=UPI002354DFAA|nr:galactokinase [Schleiferilactobacillus perolens]MCI2171757.1 galactokinase [Schleiferilactobacillus perolens]
MDQATMLEQFQQTFDKPATAMYFAPGRINLIGEHTDYNGGHVFPCAISLGTYAVCAPISARELHVYSANIPDKGVITIDLDDLVNKKENDWANFVAGTTKFMAENGTIDHGFDIFYWGNLPDGAGLSSSSALEMLTAMLLNDQFHMDMDRVTMAKLGQRVENQFIGVNSGIMDQFAIAMGKKNHAILLDTNTMEYAYQKLDLGDAKIIIMNTNKKRQLSDSKYNERRAECEKALALIQKKDPVKSLGALSLDQFDEDTYLINDATLLKRARHAVFENQRTMRAVDALQNHDLTEFGHLVNASHISLEYDYEVTGIELDTLVHTAWAQPGVIGARMIGAGFGGCAIAIVKDDAIEAVEKAVATTYKEKIGYAADFYVAEIADGPHRVAL